MITEIEFVNKWRNTDFSTYNETDVRENFIAPLLYILGYSKNTINDIHTEKSLALSESFQRLGRKKIIIDYVPTIRLKAFWILEAKPGNPREMEIGDMLQAYLYATHPEIQTPYIVLCNGWEIKIYDVHNYSEWEKPVFSIDYQNCDSRFKELRELIGAETILQSQRRDLLRRIHNTFEVEIDEQELSEFSREFEKDKIGLKKTIKENSKQLWRDEFEKKDRAQTKHVRLLDNKTLVSLMELEKSSYKPAEEYKRRIFNASPDERANLLRLLETVYLGRTRGVFKCRYLSILLDVYKEKLEVAAHPFGASTEDNLRFVIQRNLNYWEDNELENALCFLDRSCSKLAAVFVKNSMMDFCFTRVQEKKSSLPKSDLLSKNYSTAHEIMPIIWCISEGLWDIFCRLGSTEEIYKQITIIDKTCETIMAKQGIKEYPEGDHDLFNYEHYGNHYDYLSGVSCNILHGEQVILRNLGIDAETRRKIVERDYDALVPEFKHQAEITKDDEAEFYSLFMQSISIGFKLYDGMREFERKDW